MEKDADFTTPSDISIDKIVFKPTLKHELHIISICFIPILISFIHDAFKADLTDLRTRLVFTRMVSIVFPMLILDFLLIGIIFLKIAKIQRLKIIAWVSEKIEYSLPALEVCRVSKSHKFSRFLGRNMRKAFRPDGKKVFLECCIRNDEEFDVYLVDLPRKVRGYSFSPKFIGVPIDIVQAKKTN